MNSVSSIAPQVKRPRSPAHLFSLLLLVLLLAGTEHAGAQAPTWNLAAGGRTTQAGLGNSRANASAVDAAGNVFITGSFTGTVTFSGIQLVSAGGQDMFVAKWDANAQAFTWATSAGGTGTDSGNGIAVSGRNIYVTGAFSSGRNASIAGQALTGAGGADVFVAKYVDTSTGTAASSSSFANGWATSGGGPGNDGGSAIAVSGAGVFVTGYFATGTGTRLAGQALTGAGSNDMFVAKYLDTSTGNTPATSSFTNAWATSGGGPGNDGGYAIALNGAGVYVAGNFASQPGSATIAGQVLTGNGGFDVFVAKYLDTSTGNTPATSSVANGWATSGGGSGSDIAFGIAVRGSGVYITGTTDGGTMAGQPLPTNRGAEMFVAKYLDTSTGNTPATSSVANGWATSGGGTGTDSGSNIVVSGTNVLVAGYLTSGGSITIAGQALTGAGGYDVFVAKYVDTSTGNNPATSSFANAWAISGGGSGSDYATGLAVSGQQVFAVGYLNPPATFGSQVINNNIAAELAFVARLTDPALPLAAHAAAATGPGLTLFPNPASGGTTTLRGSRPGATVQVLDALSRTVATATADAGGTARLVLPAGLAAGIYVVRSGGQAVRLAVE